jgi:PEP-CTERM motif-containing protein
VAQVQFALDGFSEGNGIVSFDVAAVTPEPATLALWGLGAAGLGLARWRRRREHRDQAA